MDRQREIRKKFDELYAQYRGLGIDDLEYFVAARVAEHFINTEGVSSDEIVDEIGCVIFKKETKPVIEETKPVIEETKPVIEETKPVIEETKPITEETKLVIDVEQTTPEKSRGIKMHPSVDSADIAGFALGVGVGLVLGIVTAFVCSGKKRTGKRKLNGYLERAKR